MKLPQPNQELLLATRPASPRSLEAHMGKRIAAQRTLLGLSVEALAERAGLPLLRLQAYEASLRRVVPPDLFRLCDALGVGPACFLDGIPGPDCGGADEDDQG